MNYHKDIIEQLEMKLHMREEDIKITKARIVDHESHIKELEQEVLAYKEAIKTLREKQ